MGHIVRLLFKLSVILLIPLLCIGNCHASIITSFQEQEMGNKAFIAAKQQLPILKDPIINDYIQNLGYRLVAQSSKPHQPFYFFIVRNPTINAFSIPGGYIGIFSGLIIKTHKESELASVLAHEIAHVTQRHIVRMIQNQRKAQLSTIAAMIAAIALGGVNGNMASGATTAIMAGNVQHAINFTREHEKEADNIGMQILANAGFNPKSMPIFLHRLAKINQLNNIAIPEFLLTHPVTEYRIAEAFNRATQYPKRIYHENNYFTLIKDRLRADLTPPPPSLHNLTINTSYYNALMLTKSHEYAAATKQINTLINKYPKQILFKMTKAEIEQQAFHNKQTLVILQSLYHENPDYFPLILQYSSALIRNKKYQQALNILTNNDDMYSDNEQFLQLLFTAQFHSKQKASAHQTRAKIYLLNGKQKAAAMQLKIALEHLHKQPFLRNKIKKELAQLKTKALK